MEDLKAPARECRGCDTEIPPQAHGPGRPREFCGRDCRTTFHREKEKADVEREKAEGRAARRRAYEESFRGWKA